MSQHYYSQQPEVRHARRTIDTVLRGKKFRFTSDAGVFSKGDIDYGSRVLIEAMVIPSHASVLDVTIYHLTFQQTKDMEPILILTFYNNNTITISCQ